MYRLPVHRPTEPMVEADEAESVHLLQGRALLAQLGELEGGVQDGAVWTLGKKRITNRR